MTHLKTGHQKKICKGQERKVVTYLFFVAFFREMTLFKNEVFFFTQIS